MRKIQTRHVAEFKAAGNKPEIAILKQTNIVFVVILLCETQFSSLCTIDSNCSFHFYLIWIVLHLWMSQGRQQDNKQTSYEFVLLLMVLRNYPRSSKIFSITFFHNTNTSFEKRLYLIRGMCILSHSYVKGQGSINMQPSSTWSFTLKRHVFQFKRLIIFGLLLSVCLSVCLYGCMTDVCKQTCLPKFCSKKLACFILGIHSKHFFLILLDFRAISVDKGDKSKYLENFYFPWKWSIFTPNLV